MQDPGIFCPICNSVLETQASIGAKNQVLLNRRCKSAINHTFLISLVKLTKEVLSVRVSLSPDFTIFCSINFDTKIIAIDRYHDNSYDKKTFLIKDKVIEPDFPDLKNLRNKVQTYINFD